MGVHQHAFGLRGGGSELWEKIERIMRGYERNPSALKAGIEASLGKWRRQERRYSRGNAALVLVGLILSSMVVPGAVYLRLDAVAFFFGLIVALLIGVQNAFATGARGEFYGYVVVELEDLMFRFEDRESDEALGEIADELRDLNVRAVKGRPIGEGTRAARATYRPPVE